MTIFPSVVFEAVEIDSIIQGYDVEQKEGAKDGSWGAQH